MARHSGLGRGLGALIPGAEEGADKALVDLKEQAFREVPVTSIRPNEYQPRRDLAEEELEPLAASIKEVGVLQPLLVRPVGQGSFELIAGERRWRASQRAGLDLVPVIVKDASNEQSLEQALVENLHRKDLNPLDEASAYQQLIDDFSMTHEQVGKRVGRSRTAITNLLRLLQLPPKLQGLVSDGKLSEGHARALLSIEDPAYQQQLAERVPREALSVRAVEEAVRVRKDLEAPRIARGGSESPSPEKSRTQAKTSAAAMEWQNRLSDALDTRVAVEVGGKHGRIAIDFADLDDLDRIGALLTGH